MGDLKTVLRFGWQYMRPYWSRLLAGILLGCVCGLTAGTFIWATRTLAARLQPEDTEVQRIERKEKKDALHFTTGLKARAKEVQASLDEAVDPWLPRIGVPI